MSNQHLSGIAFADLTTEPTKKGASGIQTRVLCRAFPRVCDIRTKTVEGTQGHMHLLFGVQHASDMAASGLSTQNMQDFSSTGIELPRKCKATS